MKMKISLAIKVFSRKAKKKRHKSFKIGKGGHTKAKQYLHVPMETPSGADADINESNSSMSCLNEFETFVDEVNSEIPEVDYRGRLLSEKSISDDEEVSHSLTQSQALKLDKPVNFLKSLLSTRTPYEEFHHLFKSVPKDQFPINDFSCALSREILLQGRIYISQGWFCFYSNIFGWETLVTIDCTKIQSITREKTAYVVPNAILICTDEEKHFFSSFLSRETVYKLLNEVWTEIKAKSKDQNTFKETTATSNQALDTALSPDGNDEYREVNVEGNETIESSEVNSNCTCHGGETTEETSICWECQQTRQTATEQLANTEGTLEKHETEVTTGGCDRLYVGKKHQVVQDAARLSSCAGVAMLLASVAEMLYSYLQVSLQLVRITREQVFFLLTTFLIICLLLCSCFLLYRLSILEPKIMASTSYQPEKILLHQSMHQLWKLRQEVFDAEVTRFKTIVAANLNAITQVRQTLKMLEEDLAAHMKRNCTLLGNVCIQL